MYNNHFHKPTKKGKWHSFVDFLLNKNDFYDKTTELCTCSICHKRIIPKRFDKWKTFLISYVIFLCSVILSSLFVRILKSIFSFMNNTSLYGLIVILVLTPILIMLFSKAHHSYLLAFYPWRVTDKDEQQLREEIKYNRRWKNYSYIFAAITFPVWVDEIVFIAGF